MGKYSKLWRFIILVSCVVLALVAGKLFFTHVWFGLLFGLVVPLFMAACALMFTDGKVMPKRDYVGTRVIIYKCPCCSHDSED